MKKKVKKIPPLPPQATDQEIIKWATKYSAFDRVEAGLSEIVADHSDLDRLLEKTLRQGNSVQLNMRVPPAMRRLLTRLAKQRTTDATTLARIWLAERIMQEIGGKEKVLK